MVEIEQQEKYLVYNIGFHKATEPLSNSLCSTQLGKAKEESEL
jgi:hypothetical protein